MKLTEKELTICRATGAKWVTRDNTPIGFVCLYISEEQPPQSTSGDYVGTGKLGVLDARVFPSLERGACIKVPGKPKERDVEITDEQALEEMYKFFRSDCLLDAPSDDAVQIAIEAIKARIKAKNGVKEGDGT